ncbi:hypothetical protein [Desertibaculum subflavum]|uniref:hypothetical protein n=1 Tax=Desertibaculum subflavum TaxID=2268458 RepID=UPI000E661B7F
MQFFLTIWNHRPQSHDALQDIVLPIAAGLRDLGHEVEIGATPPRRGVTNIVIEYFREAWVVDRLRGLDYVIVATELADGEGFNNKRTPTWVKRWAGLMQLAHDARAIWVVCDEGAEGYRHLAPTVQISLGWSPSLESPAAPGPREHDIYAYGKLTAPERQATLTTLRSKLRVVTTEFSTRQVRDDLLQRSLYCYGFRPYQAVGYASTSRIVAALMQGVPVVQERVQLTTPLVDALEIIDSADDVLARWDMLVAERPRILARQLAAWRAMPASAIMDPAVAAMRPARDGGPVVIPRPWLVERSLFLRNLMRRLENRRARRAAIAKPRPGR